MIYFKTTRRFLSQGFKDQKRAGFSVIELILGLSIFAVMASSVYMIYANAVRIDAQSRRLGDLSSESYWVLKAFEEDVENMVAYRYRKEGTDEQHVAFIGEEDSMSFVTEGDDALQWVSYRLESQPSGTVQQTLLGKRLRKNEDQILEEERTEKRRETLTRRTAPFKGLPPQDTDPLSSEILTKNVATQGIKFFYAGSALKNGLSWKSQWQELGVPAAVRVVIRMVDENSFQVLELTKDILVPVGR